MASEKEKVKRAPIYQEGAGKPTINIVGGQLPEMVDAAEQALLENGSGVYQRAGSLVRAAMVPIKVSDGRTDNAMRFVPISEDYLTESFTKSAIWMKYDARSECDVPKDCPSAVSKTYLSRVGGWKVPFVSGIVNAPTLRPDGSLLSEPGYDKKSGLLYEPQGAKFPKIPESPSKAQATKAKDRIMHIVRHFPFSDEVSKSVFLSFFLTSLVRRSLTSAPGFGITAPVAGTGKSLLVDIVSIVSTGKPCGVISPGKSSEETEKRLGGVLIAGDQMVSIDNIEDPLDSDFLCQILTQELVKTRVLGQTGNPECISNSTWAFTGNNLTVVGDLTRRILQIQLDANVERPETRAFDFDARKEAMATREALVGCGLVILRAFIAAGSPRQKDALGSYEEWSKMIRDPILWLELADPVESLESVREEDPERSLRISFVQEFLDYLSESGTHFKNGEGVSTSTLYGYAIEAMNRNNNGFMSVLKEVAGQRDGTVNTKKLGNWLKKNRNKPVSLMDGKTFRIERTKNNVRGQANWYVAHVGVANQGKVT